MSQTALQVKTAKKWQNWPNLSKHTRMKKKLKGERFDDVDALKTVSQEALNRITEFQGCFKQWKK